MRINKKLNLVIPIYGPTRVEKDKDTEIEKEFPVVAFYAHSAPIQREVFEKYYSVIGKAFNQIHSGGLGILSGSKLASMVVRDIAIRDGVWDGPEGVAAGLVNEIVRLTNIFAPGPNGWSMVTFEDAISRGLLDEDDAEEVRNAATFFTLMSAMVNRRDLPTLMVIALRLWGGRLELLSGTDFMNSLATSKEPVISTAKTPEALSVPS